MYINVKKDTQFFINREDEDLNQIVALWWRLRGGE